MDDLVVCERLCSPSRFSGCSRDGVYIAGRKLVRCYMRGISASMLVVFHTIRWGVSYALTLLYIILPRKQPLC